jgi:hypothetical protein
MHAIGSIGSFVANTGYSKASQEAASRAAACVSDRAECANYAK